MRASFYKSPVFISTELFARHCRLPSCALGGLSFVLINHTSVFLLRCLLRHKLMPVVRTAQLEHYCLPVNSPTPNDTVQSACVVESDELGLDRKSTRLNSSHVR